MRFAAITTGLILIALSVFYLFQPYTASMEYSDGSGDRFEMECGSPMEPIEIFGKEACEEPLNSRKVLLGLGAFAGIALTVWGVIQKERPASEPSTSAPATSESATSDTPPADPQGGDFVDKLQQLADLHKAGALNDDEYRLFKSKLLE